MIQTILQNFKLIFWLITIIFLVSVLFKYRKNYSAIFNSYTLFITVFLYTLYWIPQGFDITDEGFTLSKSWFMLHGLWHENVGLTWGSSLINGIWLNIIGVPSVFWARIAYVLLISFIATYSYKILELYFPKKESFIFTILVSIIITFGNPQTANYQNIPTLFMLISIYYFIKALEKQNKYFLIYSGIFIGMGVFTRFPVILFIIYPLVYFFIDYLYFKNSKKSIVKLSLYFYLGLLIIALFGIIILLSTNSLSDYYHVLFNRTNNINNDTSHSLNNLTQGYLNDIWLIVSKTFFIVLSTIIVVFTLQNDKKGFFKLIISLVLSYLVFYYATNFINSQNWIYTLFAIGFSALILFLLANNDISKKQYTIIFFSIFIFFVSFFGSNNGFRLLIWSGALILPLSVFLLLLSESKLLIGKKMVDFRILQYVFIVFVLLLFFDKYKNSYRDLKKNELSYSFKSKPLIGIKSNKRRVETVDSLLTFISKNISDDETVMVVGTMPMLYFLNNKTYYTKDLWRQPEKEFINSLKNIPDYFIFPLKNPRNHWWPNGNSRALSEKDSTNYKFYLKFTSLYSYKTVYENDMFKVFKKPNFANVEDSLTKGLVAYYPFNGNANDESTNNNHGEIIGAKLTTDRNNKQNSAFYFDGKSYIKIKNDSTLNPKKELSLCAWYKPNKYKGSGSDPIVTKGFSIHQAPYYQYHLSVTGILYSKKDGGKVNFTVSPQKKAITVSSSANCLKKEKWSFIAGVYDNGTVSLYINGILISSKNENIEGIINDYGQNIHIGKGNNYEGYIKGSIDEVRIYNRALSTFEVNQLYNK